MSQAIMRVVASAKGGSRKRAGSTGGQGKTEPLPRLLARLAKLAQDAALRSHLTPAEGLGADDDIRQHLIAARRYIEDLVGWAKPTWSGPWPEDGGTAVSMIRQVVESVEYFKDNLEDLAARYGDVEMTFIRGSLANLVQVASELVPDAALGSAADGPGPSPAEPVPDESADSTAHEPDNSSIDM
jgi:hypothetical protein